MATTHVRKETEKPTETSITPAAEPAMPTNQEWLDALHERMDKIVIEMNHWCGEVYEVRTSVQALTHALGLGEMHLSDEARTVSRRRTEDDLLQALAQLEQGMVNANNIQAIKDGINEMIHLRNIVVLFMQSGADLQKRGMMAIRAITGQ